MVYYYNMFLNFDHSHVIDMLWTHLVKFQKSASGKVLATDEEQVWGWGRISNENVFHECDKVWSGQH